MPESTAAAERRADYARALNEELDQCQRAGKTERVKAIKAELERIGSQPTDRQTPPQINTAPAKKKATKNG